MRKAFLGVKEELEIFSSYLLEHACRRYRQTSIKYILRELMKRIAEQYLYQLFGSRLAWNLDLFFIQSYLCRYNKVLYFRIVLSYYLRSGQCHMVADFITIRV